MTQPWISHATRAYRRSVRDYLRWLGVDDPIPSGFDVDHMTASSLFISTAGITPLYLIESAVNRSWGGGYERTTALRAAKIRGTLTLLSIAKGLNIRGPSATRTWADIAVDLDDAGVHSMTYRYVPTPLGPVEHLESELKLCANTPDAQLVTISGPQLAPAFTDIECAWLERDLPELLDRVLSDSIATARRMAIQKFLESRMRDGQTSASAVVDFLITNPIFSLSEVANRRHDVHSERGAAGWLLAQALGCSQDRLARLGISDFDF